MSSPVAAPKVHDVGAELPAAPKHAARCLPVRGSRRGVTRAVVLIGIHVAFLVHLAHWKVTGRTLTPVEPSEAMQTLELGYLNAGFILFAVALLATLVFGRFFCGWACHLVALQDLCAWVLGRFGMRPRPLRSRLLVFVPLGIALYMFVWPTVARWIEGRTGPNWVLHLTTERFWETFPGPGMAILTLVVCGFLVVWWLGAKGFCTYGCPYGALFAATDRFAVGRILVDPAACEGCGHCTQVCTSNVVVHREVAVHGMVVDPGCMKCMDCVSACPKEALRFGFAAPKVRRKPTRRDYDVTLREDVAMAVVFVVTLLAVRNLYSVVPLLLAVGLGAISAMFAVVLLRVVRRRSFALQRHVLRDAGRWTGAGRAMVAVGVLWFAFVAHSGVVRWHATRGERLLREAGAMTPAARGPTLDAAMASLTFAERIGFVDDGPLQYQIATIERERGDAAGAEARLQRALDAAPQLRHARLVRADLLAARGAMADAERELTTLFERDRDFAPVHLRFAKLHLRRGQPEVAREWLQRAVATAESALARGFVDEAHATLAEVRQLDPQRLGK